MDTVTVSFAPPLDLDLVPDINLCDGATRDLVATEGQLGYRWENIDLGVNVFTVATEGWYDVVVRDTFNCLYQDSVFVMQWFANCFKGSKNSVTILIIKII